MRGVLVEETQEPSQAASESNMLPFYAARSYAAGETLVAVEPIRFGKFWS